MVKTVSDKETRQLILDEQFLKQSLLNESELTDWARCALEESRAKPIDNFVPMEEIERGFLGE